MTGSAREQNPHVFTVDVEEYFQVHALEDRVDRKEWKDFPSRIAPATDHLLRNLSEQDARATFFVLGWVAEKKPGLIRKIAEEGHEIASHGISHRRLPDLGPDGFRDEVRRSKQLLEDLVGQPVIGYRAPSFSMRPDTTWAFRILAEEGYRYDSSIFPVRHLHYGYPGAKRRPSPIATESGPLMEFPLTTLRIGGLDVPAAGGAWLRLLPYSVTRAALRQAEDDRRPGMVYLHPWELDAEQPRFEVGCFTRIRHYGGLERFPSRLERVLDDFEFTSIKELLHRDRWCFPTSSDRR